MTNLRLIATWVLLGIAVVAIGFSVAGSGDVSGAIAIPVVAGAGFLGLVYVSKRYGGEDTTRFVVFTVLGLAFLFAVTLGVYTGTWGPAMAMTVIGAVMSVRIIRAWPRKP